jgi:ribosomal-protein-alanine N-acetyltransferase
MRWWDVVAVHAIEEQAFPDTAWSVEAFWSELAGVPATRHYLVAERGTQIVGYAGLMAVGSEADVQTVAVAPDARRHGIGTLLLDALLDEAGRRGCSRVTLEVAAAGEDARRLYASRGFEAIAQRTGYYGPGADAVVMRLRLHSSSETTWVDQ